MDTALFPDENQRESTMKRQMIDSDMKVWDVIQDYPETYDVFQQVGCPDIRKGMFEISSHFMKLRAMAHAYHIDLEELLRSLNEAVAREEAARSARYH
jgi:hypothetical protein